MEKAMTTRLVVGALAVVDPRGHWEGNYGLGNILSAARAEEREAARTGKTPNPVDTRGEER
jgi:hypothetical protein